MTEARGQPTTQATPAPVGAAVSPELLRLLIIGRWVVLATVALVLVLELRFPVNPWGLVSVGAFVAAYNTAQLLLLRAGRLRIPPAVLIGVDLLAITLLDWFSGGVRSPFIGVYYVLIIVAAAFGELRGSLAAATAVAILEAVLVFYRPSDLPPRLRGGFAITTLPYFFLTALAAGYLVRRLREQWEQRQEAESALEDVQREVEIAREVQETLVHAPPPSVPGFAIATYSRPLHGIGGDMQDYVPLGDGIGIAVADVSGHSLAAALLAARLSHLLEELGLGTPLPRVLNSWNQAICERTPPEVFVTAAILEARSDGRVEYAVAGHPPPLLNRGHEGQVHPLECKGVALGVMDEARFEVCTTYLETGDVLLLYTDGAVEAKDANGEMLGTEGLARVFARHAALPVQELVERLGREICAGRSINDDVTLVAVAFAPRGDQGGERVRG